MMCSRNCVAVDSVYSLGTHLEKGKNSLLIGGKGSRGRQKSTPTLRSFPLLKTGSNESDMMDVGIFPKWENMSILWFQGIQFWTLT